MTTMYRRELARDRHAHMDLLSQVADSADERDNVRRILGRPLTEADLDAAQRWREQPCSARRCACPVPQACELAERTAPSGAALLRIVALALAAWAAIATLILVTGVRL